MSSPALAQARPERDASERVSSGHEALEPDFRIAATAGVAAAASVLLLPFAVNHFAQGRALLAVGSLTVVALMCLLALGLFRGAAFEGPRRVAVVLVVPVITAFLALAIAEQGAIGLTWCYPAVPAFYCMLQERHAHAATALMLAVTLPVAFLSLDTALAVRGAATLLTTSVFVAILVRTIERQQSRLRERAETDPLTGLSNRHGLEAALALALTDGGDDGVESARARATERRRGSERRRDATLPALMVVDLDHFKRVNDEHGHAAGDAVLRGAGALLSAMVGPGERAFRTGGEEFLLLVGAADGAELARRAERVRQTLADNELPGLPRVTASVGTALARAGEGAQDWLHRADMAVYRAKAAGRDRVVGG